MTNFLGIKQSLLSDYLAAKAEGKHLGYLWLVTNGNTVGTTDGSYDIYFGSRKYSENGVVYHNLINTFGELMDANGAFILPIKKDFTSFDETGVNSISDILYALDAVIKKNADDLANVYTKGKVDEFISGLNTAIASCVKEVNVKVGGQTFEGEFAEGTVTVDLTDAFAAAGKIKGITVDSTKVEADENGIIDIVLTGKADNATTLSGYGITDAYTKAEADAKFLTGVTIPEYEIKKQDSPEPGYAATYYLAKDGVQTGFKINTTLDQVLKNSAILTVEEANQPYSGAVVGDKYVKFEFQNNDTPQYLPVKDLVDVYTGSNSIEVSENNVISVKNVEATKTTLTSSIEVNGGPLADDSTGANDKWPEDWYENGVKVIPSGKSMEEILTSLFLKITNGTVKKESITWSPSLSAPSVSISKSGTVEVGTKLTATANTTNTVSNNSRTCVFTCSPGHFLSTGVDENGKLIFGSYASGSKTVTANTVNPSYDGTPSVKTYWNGEEVTNVNGTTEYTVSEVGTNTFKVDQSGVTAYAGAFDDITVYGSTNTKVPVESVKASITGDTAPAAKPLASTASKTITGARAYWMGAMATPLTEFTSDSIREAGENENSGLVKTLGANPATTLEVPAGEYDVVIVTQKEIKEVTSKAQFGSAITGNFTANHTEENIKGANGFEAIKYHVYHCKTNWDADILTISYK